MTVGEVSPAEQQEPEDHGVSIRVAARWLVTSFAAVGAVLVAGIQLQNVTHITSPWFLVAALLSVLVALLATGTVIVRASQVLVAPALTWSDLVRRESLLLIARQQASPAQHLSGEVPEDPLLAKLAEITQMQPAQFTSPRDLREKLTGARKDLEASPSDGLREQVAQLEELAQSCLRYANAWQSQQMYLRLIKMLKRAGTLIVVCFVTFLWASKPSDEPPKVTKPFPVQVYVKDSRKALKSAGLDRACSGLILRGSAVGGEMDAPQVVTRPAGRCPASSFTVSDELGIAVPSGGGAEAPAP
ncbi:hypothetical protein ACFT8Q_13390 [Streptomyces griseoincarnatus]